LLSGVLSRARLSSQGAVAAVRLEVEASGLSSTAARVAKVCGFSIVQEKLGLIANLVKKQEKPN